MIRRHVEVARLGRVVRRLLGDVVCSCLVFEVPVAAEDFAEHRIKRLLDATIVEVSFFLSVRGSIARERTVGGYAIH